jgi:hypothetical protein
MLIAALISLLCFVLQSGHLHSLSLGVSSKVWYLQTCQLLLILLLNALIYRLAQNTGSDHQELNYTKQ